MYSACQLDDIPLITLDRKITYDIGQRYVSLINPDAIKTSRRLIAGKKVLLTNGEIISGGTTLKAIELLKELKPATVKIAALTFSPHAQINPDHAYWKSLHLINKPWHYWNPDQTVRTQ